ncbi:protein-glutamate O-methyltransferase CheR [Candidatus Kapaibacterium sp.]
MSNEYSNILYLLSREIGLNIDSIGLMSLARGINLTKEKFNIQTIYELEKAVLENDTILQFLTDSIKVPETWFFRDVECYNYLHKYILENRNQFNSNNPLNILSAPCSTGEEPYSIAIYALESSLGIDDFKITAIDLSTKSLETSQIGRYRKNSFRDNFTGLVEKYFDLDDGDFFVKNHLKKPINFITANIVKNDFLENSNKFDVIFCKNLLIYLNDDARKIVLDNINKLLKNNGILMVGLSELSYFTRNGFDQIKHNFAFVCKKSTIQYETKKESVIRPTISKKNRELTSNKTSKLTTDFNNLEGLNLSNCINQIKAFANIGNYERAEKLCNDILSFSNENIDAFYYLGLIWSSKQNFDKARDYFNKVLYLSPDHYESLIHLSLIYEANGNLQKSEIYRKRAEKVFLKNNIVH